MVETDLELARLLCTRLCHDLAGPVGAVAAGVELIGGDPEQADEETLALIGDSSVAASRKLKFMRAALGGASGSTEDLKSLLDGYLDATASMGGRVELSWPSPEEFAAIEQCLGAEVNQVVLNLCLLALEIQPGCRTLSLAAGAQPSSTTITVNATGDPERAPALREDMQSAANGTGEHAITAKNVQAYITGQRIRALGGVFELSAEPQGVKVAAVFAEPLR
jgi:histidine phosphotransferase ChpT